MESTNHLIQQSFYQEVRNKKFYSLFELNRALHAWMDMALKKVMKDYGVSRWDRFQNEKDLLKEIPQSSFEIHEWRSAKVQSDCHIQVQKNFYSVPFRYAGQSVRVRLTQKMVEIFNQDHESIASHVRIHGKHQYATLDTHYPEQKLSLALFDVKHAKRKAAILGKNTQELVDHLLDGSHPLRYLRRVQGILRLYPKYSKSSLEYACDMALKFRRPRLNYIKNCAAHFEKNGDRPTPVVETRESVRSHHQGKCMELDFLRSSRPR